MRIATIVLLLAVLAVEIPSSAQVTLTLSSPTLAGSPGSHLAFVGDILNTSANEVFLNTLVVSIVGSGFSIDPTPFLFNTPPVLAAGNSTGEVELFDVDIDSAVPAGDYAGSAELFGGSDSASADFLSNADFVVHVVAADAVPEPTAVAFVTSGLLGFVALVLKRR